MERKVSEKVKREERHEAREEQEGKKNRRKPFIPFVALHIVVRAFPIPSAAVFNDWNIE